MTVKIFVIFHKYLEPIYKDSILTPLMVGNNINQKSHENDTNSLFLFDNTGENISHKNSLYNELTGFYWVYKNYTQAGDPNFVGFCHYRRYFFSESSKKAYYELSNTDPNIKEKITFKLAGLNEILKNYDFVAPLPAKRSSVLKNYKRSHNSRDHLATRNIIKEYHPDYLESFDKYFAGKRTFFHNMFIFNKNDFFRYCEWIFDILLKLEKYIDTENNRMFISERLTGVFITQLEAESKKGLFLPTIYLASKKPSFKEAIRETKMNFKCKDKSIIYKLKPLIIHFTPKILLKKRREKTLK